MSEFKREKRYEILKIKDVEKYLDKSEITNLDFLCNKIAKLREMDGKKYLQAVVVESDWPEYEPVWKMIEGRVNESR